MKKAIIAAMLLTTTSTIFAQKDLPAFGKIDKADLTTTECEFDKDAVAYKLLDYGDVQYTNGKDIFAIETKRRVRIKILKDKGLDNANIKLRFFSKLGYENITDISAVTYNLDNSGNIVTTKLEKSSIYKKPIDERISEVVFTMPDVKVGSVIEYKYSDKKESIEDLDDWYFQDDIPTRLSMYRIKVPSIFRFVNQVLTYQDVTVLKDEVSDQMSTPHGILTYNSIVRTYSLNNVPALKDEPYMGAAKDYLQRVIFQLAEIIYTSGENQLVM
jgi:hypothetical protein